MVRIRRSVAFSARVAWPHYKDLRLGSICQDFDRKILEWMQSGKGMSGIVNKI